MFKLYWYVRYYMYFNIYYSYIIIFNLLYLDIIWYIDILMRYLFYKYFRVYRIKLGILLILYFFRIGKFFIIFSINLLIIVDVIGIKFILGIFFREIFKNKYKIKLGGNI